MSGQQQYPGSDQESHIGFFIIPGGIVGDILRANLDAWDVCIENEATGQVQHETYWAESADDAETGAFNDALIQDPEGSYQIKATLERGVRKLWDVVPYDKHESDESLQPALSSELPLIGRVVATDFDAAMRAALEIYFDRVVQGVPLFVRRA